MPYVLVMESVRRPDGVWTRRAEYPELLGCVAEAQSPLEALDKLEEARVRWIVERLERGEAVPVPRPPLRERVRAADPRPGFTRWLVERGDQRGDG